MRRTKGYIPLTRGVVSIREIRAIGWTFDKSTPERTTYSAGIKTRQVNVARHSSVLELVLKLGGIDVVTIEEAQQD